jgi:hypothetical protein
MEHELQALHHSSAVTTLDVANLSIWLLVYLETELYRFASLQSICANQFIMSFFKNLFKQVSGWSHKYKPSRDAPLPLETDHGFHDRLRNRQDANHLVHRLRDLTFSHANKILAKVRC